MKYKQQFDSSDCGVACLAMIDSYFGMSLNIAKTRLYAGTDTDGTNFKGLIFKISKFVLFMTLFSFSFEVVCYI